VDSRPSQPTGPAVAAGRHRALRLECRRDEGQLLERSRALALAAPLGEVLVPFELEYSSGRRGEGEVVEEAEEEEGVLAVAQGGGLE